ncbi:hypothetical protein PYW08_013428 [Mythimna loreyi]|uniref:Uncharacterized protein n=1 Tax=Mythimna loreyi TaxID=667449 RepID=A0ACC2QGK6_9NEOP|nr:hypothetical protein PYW08_013428 [Mythimna loreyi]
MFAKFFAFFALLALAFAAPNPEPKPQVVYSAGYYPTAGVVPYASYSSYSPVAYSAYSAVPGAVYVR